MARIKTATGQWTIDGSVEDVANSFGPDVDPYDILSPGSDAGGVLLVNRQTLATLVVLPDPPPPATGGPYVVDRD